MNNIALLLALPYLRFTALAATISDPIYRAAELGIISRDDTSTCGGISGLNQCGADFPSDFCCPSTTTCMPLNTTATNGVICCPLGSNCASILSIPCDKTMQNATQYPSQQLHADPLVDLQTCGSSGSCCPPGYVCDSNGNCNAITSPATNRGSSSTANPDALATNTATTASSTDSAENTASGTASAIAIVPTGTAAAASDATTPQPTSAHGQDKGFSGTSFAAGFVPGIFLGILLVCALLWFIFRKREARKRREYDNEKTPNLTSLTPWDCHDQSPSQHATTSHGRSISDPIARQSSAHRIDFLRSSPQRPEDQELGLDFSTYNAEITALNSAPAPQTPLRRSLGSLGRVLRSAPATTPKPTQSPLPAHLRRGTFNFHPNTSSPLPRIAARITPMNSVAPIRGLNHKKSMRSLRRHATDASDSSKRTLRRETRGTLERKDSDSSISNTIVVAFPDHEQWTTPDVRTQQNSKTRPESEQKVAAHSSEILGSQRYGPPQHSAHRADSRSSERAIAAASSIYSPQPGEAVYTTPSRPPTVPAQILPAGMYVTSGTSNTDTNDSRSEGTGSTNSSSDDDSVESFTEPTLGSPYTPTTHTIRGGKATKMLGGVGVGLTVEREPARLAVPSASSYDDRRDTTFSSLMHKAGLRESDLLPKKRSVKEI